MSKYADEGSEASHCAWDSRFSGGSKTRGRRRVEAIQTIGREQGGGHHLCRAAMQHTCRSVVESPDAVEMEGTIKERDKMVCKRVLEQSCRDFVLRDGMCRVVGRTKA